VSALSVITLQGNSVTPARLSENSWDVRDLAPGFYIVKVRTPEKEYRIKIIKK
jgi:hypothetical protein